MWRAIRQLGSRWREVADATKRVDEMASAARGEEALRAATNVAATTRRKTLVERLRTARDHELEQIQFLKDQSNERDLEQAAEIERAMKSVAEKVGKVKAERSEFFVDAEARVRAARHNPERERELKEVFDGFDGAALAQSLKRRGMDLDTVRQHLTQQFTSDLPGKEVVQRSQANYQELLRAIGESASPRQREVLTRHVSAIFGNPGAAEQLLDVIEGKKNLSDVVAESAASQTDVDLPEDNVGKSRVS